MCFLLGACCSTEAGRIKRRGNAAATYRSGRGAYFDFDRNMDPKAIKVRDGVGRKEIKIL
jgi:hypothetical protein